MTMTAPTKAMAEKGDEYVARWPIAICQRIGLSPEYAAQALRTLGLVDDATASRIRRPLLRGEPVAEIGALTPDQAKAVIAELQSIHAAIIAHQRTHCQGCGLPLGADGECRECV